MGDRQQQNTDKLLSDVLKQFEDSNDDPKELQFLTSVFDFLNRRSAILAKPGISKKVLQMVHERIDSAKKSEIQNQSLTQKKTSGITADTKRSIPEPKAESKSEPKPEPKPEPESKEMEVDSKTTISSTSNVPKVVKNMDAPQAMDEDSDSDDGEKPVGNGGSTDTYVWTQSLEEVELMVEIDANLRGKHLRIEIKRKHLKVAVKGKESEPIIDGELHDAVDVEESTWTVTKESSKETKTLTIILQKVKGMCWWKRVIVGDPEIDTKKIEPENSKLDQLDDETRQTVEKMMYDQRQKAKGLPTSKEQEQQKILEKFKLNNPQMDFSKLKVGDTLPM